MEQNEFIKKFVERYKEVEKFLSNHDVDRAKKAYNDLLESYKDLSDSNLSEIHKMIAYDKTRSLYDRLNEMEINSREAKLKKTDLKKPQALKAALMLISIIFALAILFQPKFAGLVTLSNFTFVDVLSAQFEGNENHTFILHKQPISLKVSGYLTSNGSAKLYLLTNGTRMLVYDSSMNGREFEEVCIETCSLQGVPKNITLASELANTSLVLTKINYVSDVSTNKAPEWKAGYIFNIPVGTPYKIYLDDYFVDPDGDRLVYLATQAEGLEVKVEGNVVTLLAKSTGTRELTFIASDLVSVTRVPVKIFIS